MSRYAMNSEWELKQTMLDIDAELDAENDDSQYSRSVLQ